MKVACTVWSGENPEITSKDYLSLSGAKSQGMKQLMAGAGVAIVGMVLVPLLSGCSPSDRSPLKSSPPPAHSGRGRKEV